LRWAWLRFLREAGDAGRPGHGSTAELVEEIAVSGEVREAIEIARESAFTPGELETYDRFWDAVRRERTLISGSRQEGLEIGLEKGRAEGLERGREEGLEKGREEGLEKGLEKGRAEGLEDAVRRLVASGIGEDEARRMLGMRSDGQLG
jgi:flagellar biosynthesis/type III secretory pathway protein FliH